MLIRWTTSWPLWSSLLLALCAGCRGTEPAPETGVTAIIDRARARTGEACALLEQAEQVRCGGAAVRRKALRHLQPARVALDEILASDPEHPAALDVRAQVAMVANEPHAAAELCRRAAAAGAAGPEFDSRFQTVASVLHERVLDRHGRGRSALQRALHEYEVAIEALTGSMPPVTLAAPVRAEVLDMLCEHADLLRHAGQIDAAEAAYQAILDLEPRRADCYEGLGFVARANRRFGRALGEFRRALMLDPESLTALAEVSRILVEGGRGDEAERYIDRLEQAVQDAGEALP